MGVKRLKRNWGFKKGVKKRLGVKKRCWEQGDDDIARFGEVWGACGRVAGGVASVWGLRLIIGPLCMGEWMFCLNG